MLGSVYLHRCQLCAWNCADWRTHRRNIFHSFITASRSNRNSLFHFSSTIPLDFSPQKTDLAVIRIQKENELFSTPSVQKAFRKDGVSILFVCVISSFRLEVDENCAFFRAVTQRLVVISYGSFGTTYRSHLQGSLEDGLYRNVGTCQSTLRNVPEERRFHLHQGGSLKSRVNIWT